VAKFIYLEMTLRKQNCRKEGVSCIKERTLAKVPEEDTWAYRKIVTSGSRKLHNEEF